MSGEINHVPSEENPIIPSVLPYTKKEKRIVRSGRYFFMNGNYRITGLTGQGLREKGICMWQTGK
jgi:hypothetical protein